MQDEVERVYWTWGRHGLCLRQEEMSFRNQSEELTRLEEQRNGVNKDPEFSSLWHLLLPISAMAGPTLGSIPSFWQFSNTVPFKTLTHLCELWAYVWCFLHGLTWFSWTLPSPGLHRVYLTMSLSGLFLTVYLSLQLGTVLLRNLGQCCSVCI